MGPGARSGVGGWLAQGGWLPERPAVCARLVLACCRSVPGGPGWSHFLSVSVTSHAAEALPGRPVTTASCWSPTRGQVQRGRRLAPAGAQSSLPPGACPHLLLVDQATRGTHCY